MKNRLEEIWNSEYIDFLPSVIKERGFNYSINNEQKDILITGINPSYRNNAQPGNCDFNFRVIANENHYDVYWSSLKKIVSDKELEIDLIQNTAYLDIFYFRETNQNFLKKEILNIPQGLDFVIDQIELTQQIVETIIKPKLIIVKNKESAAYWGKYANDGLIWMGYDLELIKTLESGDLYRIKGFHNSSERVNKEIKTTNLKNSLIFFTQHFQYAPKNKKPNASLILEFLEIQKQY